MRGITRAADRVAIWTEAAKPAAGVIPQTNKFKGPATSMKKLVDSIDSVGGQSPGVPAHDHPAIKQWTDHNPDFTKTYFKPKYQEALKAHLGEDTYNKFLSHAPQEHYDALTTHQQSPVPKSNKFTGPANSLKKLLESPHTETSHVQDWVANNPQFQKTYMAPGYQEALKGHLGDKNYAELQNHLKAEKTPQKSTQQAAPSSPGDIHPTVHDVGKALGFDPKGKWEGMPADQVKTELEQWKSILKGQPEKAQVIQDALDKHFGKDKPQQFSSEDYKPKNDAEWDQLMHHMFGGPVSSTTKDMWQKMAPESWESLVSGEHPASKGGFQNWKQFKEQQHGDNFSDQDEIAKIKQEQQAHPWDDEADKQGSDGDADEVNKIKDLWPTGPNGEMEDHNAPEWLKDSPHKDKWQQYQNLPWDNPEGMTPQEIKHDFEDWAQGSEKYESEHGIGDKLQQFYKDKGKPNYVLDDVKNAWNKKDNNEHMLQKVLPNLKKGDPEWADELQQLFDEHYGQKPDPYAGTSKDEFAQWANDFDKGKPHDQHAALVQGIKKIFPNADVDSLSTPELKKQLEDWDEHLEPEHFPQEKSALKGLYDQHFGGGQKTPSEGPSWQDLKKVLPGLSDSGTANKMWNDPGNSKSDVLQNMIKQYHPGSDTANSLQELYDQHFGQGNQSQAEITPEMVKQKLREAPDSEWGDLSEFDGKSSDQLKNHLQSLVDQDPNMHHEAQYALDQLWGKQQQQKTTTPTTQKPSPQQFDKGKYYDVMGYPSFQGQEDLPQYMRQNPQRGQDIKFPRYKDEQETLPLPEGEHWAPHYAPMPIYRVMNLNLDHQVNPEQAPVQYKTPEQKAGWAQAQVGRLRRIDHILNGDSSARDPQKDLAKLKSWGQQYGLTNDQVKEVQNLLFSEQPDLFTDDKWQHLHDFAQSKGIDPAEMHDLAAKLDVTPPSGSKGNYDHPELGKLILDYLENTRHRSGEGGGDSQGGLGWHWTRAINKMYKGVPDAGIGQEQMKATPRNLPIALSGLWSGEGEGSGHGGAYSPEHSGEKEHNLRTHAPVHIRRVQIRSPGEENQGYGAWHDVIDPGPFSTWTPGRYEEGDERHRSDYAPGEMVGYKPSLSAELDKVTGNHHDDSFNKLKPGPTADALFSKLIAKHPEKKQQLLKLYQEHFVGRPDLPTKPHMRRASLITADTQEGIPVECGPGYSYNWQTDECESGLCPDGFYYDPVHNVCTPYPESACPPGFIYDTEHGVCVAIPDNSQPIEARKRKSMLVTHQEMRR